ncbi:exodeoxyribonuclease VII small subunit [Acidipropionibacterium virtanenii]|uniref:Exodeoxyribonuclease 7 small subunit n=1 Tax=Acidipropionibacterium virtanenii TaxID=2057246 RepID=A0A344UVX1_9ACTN|nr:exodeoxyribonuclease VII small subunit [Acidipropionibacterium virtanenii]AXE39419.1 Exodeoxyribonuclease 7 small subunit [Acidipropionibacterium virtanenii]
MTDQNQETAQDQVAGEPEIGYEQARDELVEVVRRLESGGTSLAETMTLWERGEKLAAICQTWLDGARRRIEDARAASENINDNTDRQA